MSVDADVGLSFLRGMFAAINPCGFVLLPTYLAYFLGAESAAGPSPHRASLRRALLVGAAVSSGFLAVFVTVGVVASGVHAWVIDQSRYVTLALGVGFVVAGTAILAGFRPRFGLRLGSPSIRDRTVSTMFGYGVAYAIASLGCTMPVFIPVVSSPRGAVGSAVNVAMYAAGMSLLVVALTVSLAVANQFMLRALRSVMRHADVVAGALMVMSGLYLVWYFVVVDVQQDSDAVIAAMSRWQTRAAGQLNDHWQPIAAILAVVVATALGVVWMGRRPRRRTSPATTASRDD